MHATVCTTFLQPLRDARSVQTGQTLAASTRWPPARCTLQTHASLAPALPGICHGRALPAHRPTARKLALRAFSKSFHAWTSSNKWPGSRRTPQPRLPVLARGATKSLVICCLAPRVALQRQHLLPCKCGRTAGPFVLCVSCSVFRALRLAATAFAKQRTQCEDFEQALTLRQHGLRTQP